MESTSLTFKAQSPLPFSKTISHHRFNSISTIHLNPTGPLLRLQFIRRHHSNGFHQQAKHLANLSRNWGRGGGGGGAVIGDYYRDNGDYEDDDDGDDDDEEEDRSLDLLVKFVENVFKKISRRARRAVRSVLPVTISTRLVGFSVNGIIILTFLWVLKAFLEVVCTLGSVVFISILVIRGVWTGISFLQENHNHREDELDDHAWRSTQPVTL